MKKLILALLMLSSCNPSETVSQKPDPPVINCMMSQSTGIVDDGSGDWSMYHLSSSFDRDKLDEQIKITMNNEVMFDSCALTSAPGFSLYPYDSTLYLSFDLKRNLAWKNRYFDTQNNPKRWSVGFKLETKVRCEDTWDEAFYSTRLAISWSYQPGGCAPPGYAGSITVPL